MLPSPLPLLLALACTDPGTPSDTAPEAGPDTGGRGPAPLSDEVLAAIRRSARVDLRAATATAASVAVWKEGEIVYAEAFGSRDPDGDVPATPDTLFQIGSDTKKLTAIVALQQVARGALSLDTTLADGLPSVRFADPSVDASRITLHALLTHTSGIVDYTPWVEAPADADLAERAAGRLAAEGYAMFPSGATWSYSNAGYALAGLLAEQAAGRPYGDLLNEDLFAPLGLARTFARRDDALLEEDVAIGVGLDIPDGWDTFDPFEAPAYAFGTVPLARTWDCGFTRPAGLVWSTASDMARLAGFLVDGDPAVLDDDARAALASPHVPLYPASDSVHYGYGMMVNGEGWNGVDGYHPDVPLWSHGGNTMSMTSRFFVLPEQRIAVAILSNGYGDAFDRTAVTAMEALTELPTAGSAPELLAPPEAIEVLAGTYHDPVAAGTLRLRWDGEALRVEAPDLVAMGFTVGETLRPVARDMLQLTVNGEALDLNVARADGRTWLVNRSLAWGSVPPDSAARRVPPRGSRVRAAMWRPRDLRESVRGMPVDGRR
jgi:CubicO group peptidase (beta-lactamase class C family)